MIIDASQLPAFTLATVLIVITPGADLFLLLQTSMRSGSRHGIAALLGIHLGNLIQGALVVSGVGLLLSRNESLMTAIRWAGAAYLGYLGLSILRGLLRSRNAAVPTAVATAAPATESSLARSFTRGFATNITNPKVLLFFLAFFPQFIGHPGNVALQLSMLSAVFIVVAFGCELLVVLAASKVSTWFDHRRLAGGLDAACGVAFLAIAVALVAT